MSFTYCVFEGGFRIYKNLPSVEIEDFSWLVFRIVASGCVAIRSLVFFGLAFARVHMNLGNMLDF